MCLPSCGLQGGGVELRCSLKFANDAMIGCLSGPAVTEQADFTGVLQVLRNFDGGQSPSFPL
jgi:hypothetical protein